MRKDISACYGHKSDGHRQFYGFTMPTNSMYTSFPTSSSLAFRSFAYFTGKNVKRWKLCGNRRNDLHF